MRSSAMSSSREQSYRRSNTRGSPVHFSSSVRDEWRVGAWIQKLHFVCKMLEKMPSEKPTNLTGILPAVGTRALPAAGLIDFHGGAN